MKVALNLCRKHYTRFKKYGHTDDFKVINLTCLWCKMPFKISVPSKQANYPKYCSNRCKKENLKDQAPLCKSDGCNKKSLRLKGGFCTTHHTRFYVHGDPTVVKKLAKYPEGTKCKVEGCKNQVLANFMCNKHYIMWKVHGDPKGGKFEYKIRKAVTHSDGTRTCSECETRLPIKEFHKDKGATDGFRSKCKKCRIQHVKKWYLKDVSTRRKVASDRRRKDPEKLRKQESERYERNKDKRILLATEHSHLRRARKKKVKTVKGISKKSLMKRFGTKCFYCNKEMNFKTAPGRRFTRNMATIEHIIPLSKGGEHTFENTVLACRHCNLSKNSKTVEEFEEYLQEVKKLNP